MSKICTRCPRKHNEDGSYCVKCKEYMAKKANTVRGERNRKNFPAPDKAIYGIIDENKNIVYVGESKTTPYRLYRHFNSGEGNTTLHEYRNKDWSYVILWDGTDKSKQDRLLLEAVLIQSLRPKYNKQWQQED